MNTPLSDAMGLAGAEAAMLRAAEQVRRRAAQAGTPIVVWQDGRVVLIPPSGGPLEPAMPPERGG